MVPGVGALAVLLTATLAWPCASAHADQGASGTPQDRRLDDALAELQRRGLRIIYSSQVVRPDMRVPAAPDRGSSLRRTLDGWLALHGLIASNGPGGTVLIVKNPRARVERSSPPRVPASAGEGPPRRFEETVRVIDTEPGAAGVGPAPLAVRPLEVQAMAGAVENVYRTLQALPGVVSTDELGSRIAVRGGGPDQNLTIVDGIEIHNPFRLVVPDEDLAMVGVASAFSADTIDRIELHPGAFDVRYGDRLSSLLVVTHREGSEAEALQGALFLGLADANVMLEGKLPRASGSWLVSARRTHLGLMAERVIGTELPSFQDVDARVSWRPRPSQRLALSGIVARERTRPTDTTVEDASRATRIRNDLLALTFEAGLGARAFSRTVASWSRLTDALGAYERSLDNSRGANTADSIATGGLLQYQLSRDVAVRDLALRQELFVKPSVRHALDLGVEAHALDTRWAWAISGDRSLHEPDGSSIRLGSSLPAALDSSRDSSRFGAWVQDRWQVSERLALQPGLRVDRSSLTGQTTLSPRLGGRMLIGPSLRLDAALRVHSQSPGYEKVFHSDRFLDLSPRASATLTAERALHAVVGLEQDFGRGTSARVDAYYKRFTDLIVGARETDSQRLGRLSGYDVPEALRAFVPTRAEITTTPTNGATGTARGVEVYVAHHGPIAAAAFSGWAAYSFGIADRTAYGVTHPFDYDRRHSVSAAARISMGPRVDLSATVRWATGLPRTPVAGVRLSLAPDTADLDGDGNHDEQVLQRDVGGNPLFQPDMGDVNHINSARLPHFARLDTRVTYRPGWSGERWAFYVDVVNVLNARNVTKIDSSLVFDPRSDRPGIIERAEDRGVPTFPSFGIRFWF